MKLGIDIVFGFFTLLVFTFLNSQGLVDGPSPSFYNFVLSILFLTIWFLYGLSVGREKRKSYTTFAIVFWGLGCIISIICNLLRATPLWILALLYLGPLNGFRHFTFINTFGYIFLIINTGMPLLITLFGYVMGNKISKGKTKNISV